MSVECYEIMGSRRYTADDKAVSASMETKWQVEGTNDEEIVRSKLLDTAFATYADNLYGRLLIRATHEIEQIDHELWECTVGYTTPEPGNGGSGDDNNSIAFSFDITGATAHITQSKKTRRYTALKYALQEILAPNLNGAIGARKDGVEGVDVPIPSLKFIETHPRRDWPVAR
ncbi:MAG: hypothetical protein AB7O68_08200 [Pirellulales bacterium]